MKGNLVVCNVSRRGSNVSLFLQKLPRNLRTRREHLQERSMRMDFAQNRRRIHHNPPIHRASYIRR